MNTQTKRVYTQYVLDDDTEFLATEEGKVIAKKDETSSFYTPAASRTHIKGSREDSFPEEPTTYTSPPIVGQFLLLGRFFTMTEEGKIKEINKINYFASSLFREKQYK